jgi:RNA polymerase sigma factor (sigma-70 family)
MAVSVDSEARISNLGGATLENYIATRKQLRAIKERAPEEEVKTITGMITDSSYVIDWLRTGNKPGRKKPLYSEPVDRRTVFLDPEIMSLFPNIRQEPELEQRTLSDDQKRLVLDALRRLSDRERHFFMLKATSELTYDEIARELKITKSSVGTFITRAEKKLEAYRAELKDKAVSNC